MKAVRLNQIGCFAVIVVRIMTTQLHIEKRWREVGFLVVPELATNVNIGKAFIGKYIERIGPKFGLTMPDDSGSVAAIDETRSDHIVTVLVKVLGEKFGKSTADHSCVISWVTKLPSMSEKMLQVKTSSVDIQLATTHKNLVLKWAPLVTQAIVDTAPGIPSHINMANILLSCRTFSKEMMVASYVALPQSCFEWESIEHKPDTLNAVHLYKFSWWKKKILLQQYDTKQQDAKLQDKHWIETVQINEKYKDIRPTFLTKI